MIEKQGGQLYVSSTLNQGANFTSTMAKGEMEGLEDEMETKILMELIATIINAPLLIKRN